MLLERRCIAGEGGRFAPTLITICILILLPESVHYYCKIERKSTILIFNDVIKRRIEAGRVEYRKKKNDLETRKKGQKSDWPGGIEPALGKAPAVAGRCGPELSGHSDYSTLKLAYLIQHKFPVPHRQSPPSRLFNLNKTPY